MKWYHWIWVPLVAVASFLTYALTRAKGGFSDTLATEVNAINAKADAKKLVTEQGADIARAKILTEHTETVNRLSEKQKAEADRLRSDPAGLAVFLTRIGSGK
jgi:hypothetical protein